MVSILSFLLFAYLISFSKEGSCAITTRVRKYTSCRDKEPTDERNNVCCYLEAKTNNGTQKYCVEMRGVDLKKSKFKDVKNQIKAGTYDYWLMDNYTGFEAYKTKSISINKIESLRCNNSQYLKFFGLLAIIFILL